MFGYRSITPLTRGLALLGGLALLAGCASIAKGIQDSEVVKLIGLGSTEPCGIQAGDWPRLAGAYLRQSQTSKAFDVVFVTGRPSFRTDLPRTLTFDDSSLLRIRSKEDGKLRGSRASQATPRVGFGDHDNLPAVYDLRYVGEDGTFVGPLVVGPGPTDFELPSSGSAVYRGKVELTLSRTPADGSQSTTVAEGMFTTSIGFGSQRGFFAITDLKTTQGDPLPFVDLTWQMLGLCGPRLISSGQGQVKVSLPNGIKISPFQQGREPVPLMSTFESAQFANTDPQMPPIAYGGVFVVQSDEGTLSGIFLTEK